MKKLILILVSFSVALFAQTEVLNIITGFSESTLHTAATVVLDVSDCNNELHINNDADVIDFTLPPAEAGLVVMFYDKAGGVITVDTATGDEICLNGTDLTAGYSIDSPGAVGDFIVLFAIDGTHWVTLGQIGTWIDGGA
jgi:hypothetical protein